MDVVRHHGGAPANFLEIGGEAYRLSKEALEKAEGELKKLKNMSPMSAEATVVRNYVDWLLKAPWKKRSKVLRDLNRAEGVLEEDHLPFLVFFSSQERTQTAPRHIPARLDARQLVDGRHQIDASSQGRFIAPRFYLARPTKHNRCSHTGIVG